MTNFFSPLLIVVGRVLLRSAILVSLLLLVSPMDTYAQDLDSNNHETRKEQGHLEIGDLHSRPGRLSLPYHYYRRGKTSRPTIFFLSGGPGLSNLKWTPPESWLQDFDIVFLEYRGVGRSSITLNSKHFRQAVTTPTKFMSLAEASPAQEKIALGFQDLQNQGIDLKEFSVSALVDDIERLRLQLKLPRIYLVAHSFGTRVALWYQTRYRQATAGSVMFALNTPGGFIWYPDNTRSVWERYRQSLLKSNPELAEQMKDALNIEHARRTSFGFWNIKDTHALTVAFFLSFNASTRDRAFKAMANASRGNTGGWSMMAWSYPLIARFSFNWADFFVKAYSSDCDREAVIAADQQAKNSPFQSPSSILFSACNAYMSLTGQAVNETFIPDYRDTLAIVGEFDPSTPIERKPQALADDAFVVIKNAGHADVLYNDPDRAAHWLRTSFLHSPSSTAVTPTP